MNPLRLPRATEPQVSVVMVTYGGADLALEALGALVRNTDAVYEVIVVDNASPDGSGERLRAEVEGATVVLNGTNVGFAAASNRGAANAVGDHLCFLNPDALVEEGWLAPLLTVLEGRPEVGAVVPRLLNLDGTVQETGSLVGRDGVTWALGQGADPGDPAFRFPLTVDFGSAACMVLRRTTFHRVGGFDTAFQPAYVEDVDLGLMLAAAGFVTVVEPRSSVRHGRSAVTGAARAEALIRANRNTLLDRWAGALSDRPWLSEPAYFPHRVAATRDLACPDRIMVMADRVPAAHAELHASLLELAAGRPGARVTLVAGTGPPGAGLDLAEAGIEVVTGPDAGWFEGRRYHASVVLATTRAFDDLLTATQPQATIRWVDDLPADPAALAALGVAPPEHAPAGSRDA
ncbi:MAG TPA: glycosyltransferase family 2 protein [Actinomycetota bacterium]